MKKCFTITVLRSTEDIKKAEELLVKTGIYQGCEIFYPYDVSEEIKETYAKNIERFMKYPDFEIVCHLPYGVNTNPATYNNLERTMQRYYDAIDFCVKYNVKGLTLHPGHEDGVLTHEESVSLSIENTKKICDYAKKYGMYIMLENMVNPDELCLTLREMLDYHKRVDRDNLKLTFDCGHYHASAQNEELPKDLSKYVLAFKDKIAHLHLHDNCGSKDQHLKLGEGTIDFKQYFNTLKSINYDGLYGSEVLFKDYEELLYTAQKIYEYYNEEK